VSSIDLVSIKIQILDRKVLFKNLGLNPKGGRSNFLPFLFLYLFHFFHEKVNIKTYTGIPQFMLMMWGQKRKTTI
jgi:hypothetical protein